VSTYFWQGNLIRLRAVEPADWETFHEWNRDSDAARETYYLPFPKSEEATRRWTEKEALKDPENDVFRLVIETLTGEMVGTINTHSCDARNGTFSYGLAVGETHRRKGYASEAITLLLRFFFHELRYQKATVHIYSFNEASVRLHERLGFQLEGRTRSMIYSQGLYFDELIFGITSEEFSSSHSPSAAP
jgi:RimJ/RimL family protein N-acetyltransferase